MLLVSIGRIGEEDTSPQQRVRLGRSGRKSRGSRRPGGRRKDRDIIGRVEPSTEEVVDEVVDVSRYRIKGS